MVINIKQVQQLLVNLGKAIVVDGIWGVKSQIAMDEALQETQKSSFDELIETTIPNTTDEWANIKYFKREEFRCPCGICGGFPVEPDRYTIETAEEIRKELGAPMTIIPLTGNPHAGGSGVRCQRYNDSLPGSVPNSWHTKGKAFDFVCTSRSATQIEYILQKKQAQGKIRYWYKCGTNCYHVDTGGIN